MDGVGFGGGLSKYSSKVAPPTKTTSEQRLPSAAATSSMFSNGVLAKDSLLQKPLGELSFPRLAHAQSIHKGKDFMEALVLTTGFGNGL